MRFLHVTTFYPPYSFGGDAMYIYRLAHALGDLGHEVDVVHCVDSYHLLQKSPPCIAYSEHPRVTRHELRSSYGPLSPLLTHQSGRPLLKQTRLRHIFMGKPYDVVHFHNMSLLGPATLRMTPPGGRAIKLYTTHEHWLICPTHVLWKFNQRPCEKPACLRCVIHSRRPPQWWRYTGLLDEAAKHVDQFVSPSRFTAEMHAKRGFSQKVDHLPYFLDRVDGDWQQPAPRPHEKPYFLFVGRLELIKGLHTLIEFWKSRGVESDLLVAGAGSQEADLRARAGNDPRIRFLGPLPQKALGALYYHALATIVPSVTYETFGMINIESFARKTPVIVRDLGALPEVVNDSGGGFIYRTDEELLQAVQSIGNSPRLRAELGEEGYQALLRWWCLEAHLRMYFEFLGKAQRRKVAGAEQTVAAGQEA